jgi:hypothetical protein
MQHAHTSDFSRICAAFLDMQRSGTRKTRRGGSAVTAPP